MSSLTKTLGEQQTSTATARGSSGSYKDEMDGEFLFKFQHPQLKELYGNFLSWEPKPELARYHISFMKHYLSLPIHYQEHHMCQVLEKFNKSLFHWIHNQKMYLRWYKLGITGEKGRKFHINNRYVRYLKKVGVTV